MGFQTGTQIRPELMRGDTSGFTEAARLTAQTGQMWGQALQNVGQQIEGTLKKKKEDEDRKAKEQAAANILMSQVGLSASDAAAAVKGGMADTVISMNMQKQKMEAQAQQDAATAAHRASVLGQGQQRIDMTQAAADVKAKNAEAQETAIATSTDTSGDVDWEQAISIYTEQGGTDLEAFADAAKAAKGVTKGPDKFTTETIGEFQVLLKNGNYVIGKGTGSDDKTPSSVKSAKATIEAIGEARELYNDGTKEGKEKAKDILQSWRVMDNLGFPADVDAYFGSDKNKDPLNLGL